MPATVKSRVVIARDPKPHVATLLDRAMQSFFNCDTPVEAWRKVVCATR